VLLLLLLSFAFYLSKTLSQLAWSSTYRLYIYILKELNIRTLQVPNIGLSDGMIYAMHKEELEK
jgi:hypothetical protein